MPRRFFVSASKFGTLPKRALLRQLEGTECAGWRAWRIPLGAGIDSVEEVLHGSSCCYSLVTYNICFGTFRVVVVLARLDGAKTLVRKSIDQRKSDV